MYTFTDGRVFLYLNNSSDNGDADYCGLYNLSGKHAKCILDFHKVIGKFGYHNQGFVKAIDGDKLTVTLSQVNYSFSGLVVDFIYKNSNGKLKLVRKESKDFEIWAGRGRKQTTLTAAKNLSAYKKANKKTTAFTIKKNDKVKPLAICNYSGKLYLKIRNNSTKKIGYIKLLNKYPKDDKSLFKHVVYVG